MLSKPTVPPKKFQLPARPKDRPIHQGAPPVDYFFGNGVSEGKFTPKNEIRLRNPMHYLDLSHAKEEVRTRYP
jgi:hypothetical protein